LQEYSINNKDTPSIWVVTALKQNIKIHIGF
jgi:hypothetical protein